MTSKITIKKIMETISVPLKDFVCWETLYSYTNKYPWELEILRGQGPSFEDILLLFAKPDLIKPGMVYFTVTVKDSKLNGEKFNFIGTEISESERIILQCVKINTLHNNNRTDGGVLHPHHIRTILAFPRSNLYGSTSCPPLINAHIGYYPHDKTGVITLLPLISKITIPRDTPTFVDRDFVHHIFESCPANPGVVSPNTAQGAVNGDEMCHYCKQHYVPIV